jgi:cytochrome c551/c552
MGMSDTQTNTIPSDSAIRAMNAGALAGSKYCNARHRVWSSIAAASARGVAQEWIADAIEWAQILDTSEACRQGSAMNISECESMVAWRLSGSPERS